MSRQHHELKTDTEVYQAVEKKLKTFEFRLNDRNFREGDMVTLWEVVGPDAIKTGRYIGPLEIIFVLRGGKYGLPPEYCVFNWKPQN